jgi:anaerobic C4-dicarboxylate transporter DcuB
MIMLGFGAFILFATNINAKDIAKASVFAAGMTAVVSIFGIANQPFLIAKMRMMVQAEPWTFASAMFCVSAFVKSQAATLTVMMPFGIALGLPATPPKLICQNLRLPVADNLKTSPIVKTVTAEATSAICD